MDLMIGTNRTLLSIAILILRCMLGIIMFVAGAGKLYGWFGGMGIEQTIGAFKTYMGLSSFWTYLSCYTEFIGGAFLILGLLTRPAAFAVWVNMLVASIFVGFNGFFGEKGGAYPFSLMISSLIILLSGPMLYSLDALLFGRSASKETHNTQFRPTNN